MARKRNIIARTPRSYPVLFPKVRNLDSFFAMTKILKRWPQLFRVHTAGFQSGGARYGKKTERERASLEAWNVLVASRGESMMLNAPLDENFLGDSADVLEDAGIPDPEGGADWLGKGNYRVRDLIKRHRKRLQPLKK